MENQQIKFSARRTFYREKRLGEILLTKVVELHGAHYLERPKRTQKYFN